MLYRDQTVADISPFQGQGSDVAWRGLRLLWLVSGLFFVLWSFIVPVFEAPDEAMHWQYARYLHDEWRLPVYGPLFVEANSPPLYYAAVAPIARRTPTPPPLIWPDGRGGLVHPFGVRLHLTAADDYTRYWPIRAARLASSLMALAAVYLCGLAAREVTGRDSTALLAAGFAAFLPQFTFRGMNVSGDVLVAAMSAWFLCLCLRLVMRGFTWRIGALAAVALAGAYLSKINAICLAPVLALAILSEPVPWRRRVSHLAVMGLSVLLVAPWSYRNVVLYGDPFAIKAMYQAIPSMIVERSLFDPGLHRTLPRELFKSFVGVFGYGVKLPKWVYAAYLAFMAIPAVGLAVGLWQDRRTGTGSSARYGRVLLILAAIVALNYLVVVRINSQLVQPQARFMFPALPAIAVAIALGLEKWAPWRRRLAAASVLTVGAWGGANAAILLMVVLPAYHPPPLETISRVVTPVELTGTGAGVQPGGQSREFGAERELAGQVHVPAPDARFVIFDIQGQAPNPEAVGSVVLGVERQSGHQRSADVSPAVTERRFPFRWLADGKRRTIYLTTLTESDWEGTVVSIRVLPVDDGMKGRDVLPSVSDVRLAGSIPTHDY